MDGYKRCPFCGGEAIGRARWSRHGTIVYVTCRVCGATTKPTNTDMSVEEICKEENWDDEAWEVVTARWNNRYKEEE